MVDVLSIIAKKHFEWVEMVQRFGCTRENAEDIVQEMYIKIKKRVDEGADVMFDEKEANYYYIFTTVKNLFLDQKRKESKYILTEIGENDLETEQNVLFAEVYEQCNEVLSTYHWYDQKIYEIVESGTNIRQLAKKTTISYYSLYNTYNKVKKGIKKKLNLWD